MTLSHRIRRLLLGIAVVALATRILHVHVIGLLLAIGRMLDR